MEVGRYTRHRVDFSKYSVAFFNPYLFAGYRRSLCGCGAGALAALTGVAPEIIAARNGSPHYADRFMRRFLRDRGFAVVPLTMCKLSDSKAALGSQNVILLSQLFRRNEATWGSIFGSIYVHNFDVYTLEALSFLNKPVLTAYVVSHPKWRTFMPIEESRSSDRRSGQRPRFLGNHYSSKINR